MNCSQVLALAAHGCRHIQLDEPVMMRCRILGPLIEKYLVLTENTRENLVLKENPLLRQVPRGRPGVWCEERRPCFCRLPWLCREDGEFFFACSMMFSLCFDCSICDHVTEFKVVWAFWSLNCFTGFTGDMFTAYNDYFEKLTTGSPLLRISWQTGAHRLQEGRQQEVFFDFSLVLSSLSSNNCALLSGIPRSCVLSMRQGSIG